LFVDLTQLTNLDSEAVKNLMPKLFAQWNCQSEIGKSEAPWIDQKWMTLLWQYLRTHFDTTLHKMEDLHILPLASDCSSLLKLSKQLAVVSRTNPTGPALSSELVTVCDKLGIYIINDILPDLYKHPQFFDNYAFLPNAKGMLQAMARLLSTKSEAYVAEKLLECTDKVRFCLRNFLAKDINSLNLLESDRQLLRILPIFVTVNGSGREKERPVSLAKVNIAAPSLREGKIPVPSPKVLLNLEDESSKQLAAVCGVKQKSVVDIVAEVYFPGVKNGWYSSEEVATFMKYFCENFKQFQPNYCNIEQFGRDIMFVQKADGTYVKPCDVFNEEEKLMAHLFSSQAAFPTGEFSKPKYRDALIAMGLRNSSSVTATEMHEIAINFSSDKLPADERKKVADAFNQLLNIRSELLDQPIDSRLHASLRDKLRGLPCIPIMCKRVDLQIRSYPQSLAFYGENVASEFATPDEVKAAKYAHLVGSVRPLVNVQDLARLAKIYGWNNEPDIQDVKQHLMTTIDCYNCQQKVQFLNVIISIYRFLSDILRKHKSDMKSFVTAMAETKWIWNGESFSYSTQVVLDKESIDLKPFRFTLPSELSQFKDLWTECGLRRTSDLTEVLQAVSDAHERENDFEKETVDRHIQLCVNILNLFVRQKSKNFESVLVPVNTKSGKLQMKPATECTYIDKEWYKHEFDIEDLKADVFLIHELVPLKTAEELNIPSLISRTLGVEELDIGFGQSERLTTRLNTIVRDYTDELTVLKELIQNADDAGATEVCFLYDERCNENARSILLDPGMKDLQGPALWTYNNAVFTDSDFDNIVKLSGAAKKKDGQKIGRFGLGFNAVYHLTDVPSFISRGNIVFFDPHTNYLGHVITNKSKPGIKLNLETHQHKIQGLTDQFKPYNGLFGCDISKDSTMKSYEGTLFRFPLRTEEQARKSEISKQRYSDAKMMELLRLLKTNAHHMLLYTQSVQLIKVFHLTAAATSAQEMTLWLSVQRHVVKVMRNVTSPPHMLPKDTRKLPTDTALPNILQHCSTLMKSYNENCRSVERSPFCEFSAIYNVEVKYGSEAHTKFADSVSTDSDSYWLVVSCSGRNKSLELAREDSSLIPVGGVAAQLEKVDDSSFTAVGFGLNSVGIVYCFLPLHAIEFKNLPVHINGFFDVDSNRTRLYARAAMDKEDKRAIWNEALICDTVCQAYCILLQDLTRCSPTTSYNIWPTAKSLKEIPNLEAHLYQSLYHRICTDENCAIVKADKGWVSLNKCRLLDPDFRKDEIADLALHVLKVTTRTDIIVDIPEAVVKTALEVESCKNVMQQKFVNKLTFFKDWFFPNVRKVDAVTRNKLVLSCLFDEKLNYLLRDIDCIPVSPDGEELKTISELVHPECKLAELYDADEGHFPLWKSGVADDDEKMRRRIYDALVKLGMKKHDISWETIADRCMVVQSNPGTAAKRTKVLLYLMQSKLTRKLNPLQPALITICHAKFLPAMEQPRNFPIKWKGDDNVLISSKEGYLSDKTNLVCCSYPVIDEQYFDTKDVKDMLGLLQKQVKLSTVVNQMRELQVATTAKHLIENQDAVDMFSQVYNAVFSFLNKAVNKLNSQDKAVLGQLSDTKCVLVEGTLLMLPGRCALTSADSGLSMLPYLAVVPSTAAMQYREVYRAIGVKESFTLADYVWLLQEVQEQSQGRKLNANELKLVINIINQCVHTECQKSHPVSIPMENLPVPNAADCLCPASSLSYNNCPWLITPEDTDCCNQNITYPATVSIGIKTIRQEVMKRHRLALPFGQKKRLVKRIKRIIESYPFNENILKEMLQNADDAGATTIHFIRDIRSLKTEKVFDDTWKAIQGPALCVYNNRSFTEKHLKGIQSLGEGSKSDDPVKTGQYGVGFNCVYHLTDVPTFLTTVDGRGTVLCAFDPNCNYVPGADSQDPGGMFQVTENLKKNFCDVFSGYFLEEYDTSHNGTMFRLPLRTNDMARHSEISNKSVTVEDIQQSLIEKFRQDMYEALLFVNSVEEIRLRDVVVESIDNVQLQDVCSVRVRLTEAAKAQRNFLHSKMKRAATKLKKRKQKLCEVEMTEVVYELTTEDSDKKQDVWQIVQRLGFEDAASIPKIVSDAYHSGDLGLLPVGGVAYLKQSYTSTTAKSKRLFCFLPLPVQLSQLPVHVNGHFVLNSESRRGLWTEEHKTFKSEWNRCVMEGIVAPAYCTLIRVLKNCLINSDSGCSGDENKAIIELNKFHSVFPEIAKSTVTYETSLATAVYKYIGTENLDVLPLLTPAKQIRDVKWIGPLGQLPNKKVYIDDLESQMKISESMNQFSRTIFRSSGAIGIQTAATDKEQTKAVSMQSNSARLITQALMRCGFLLFACPIRLCKNFEKADVCVRRIKPEVVLDFFASYNEHATQCKLGSVPCKLSETPLKEIEFVEALLKYCSRVTDCKQRLHGLPLLVTKSLTLTSFNSQDRKYVTDFSDVAPNAPDMFVHLNISNVLQLNSMEDTHVCQNFDVAEFCKLLPAILNERDYYGNKKSVHITKLQELLREHNYDTRWLAKVWSFFASFVLYSTSTVQPDKANTETILMPVVDWCLLPVSCEHRDMLVPICQSSAVLNLTDETPNEFVHILKKLGVAELNWKYIDKTPDQEYFMKSLLGHIQQPECIVLAFKHLLHQSTLEGVLSTDKGLRLLAYFSEHVANLRNDSDTKDVISQLPFFVSVYDKQVSINRTSSYVLPSLPGNGMEIWREQLDVTFLKQESSIELLIGYLECKCLTVVEAYTTFIFPHFDKLSITDQAVHIAFVKDHLRDLKHLRDFKLNSKAQHKEITALTKATKSLAFLPSQQTDGSLVTASNYYDIYHKVFRAMLPKTMFPPPPYCELDWREFLLDCGIIHEVTEDMFVKFATYVESRAAEEVNDTVCEQSEILLRHFLQQNSFHSVPFLDRIKTISFIQAHKVGEHLESLHPQHGIRDAKGRLQFICLQHSVLYVNKKLIWTTKNILPQYVNEYEVKADKDRQKRFVNLMQHLQVVVQPSADDVAQHVKQLCTSVIEEATHGLHNKRIAETLEDTLKCAYTFMKQQLPLPKTVASLLSDTPFVYDTDSCRLLRPSSFATDILESHEIRPYLNKFPLPLGEFINLFVQVGTTKTPTVCQYAGVLEAIHDKTGQHKLLPDKSKAVSTALKGMLEVMLHDKQEPLPLPERIYFPSRSNDLRLSSDVVYVDNESLLTRLNQFQKPLLVDLKSVCDLTNEEDVKIILKKLPLVQQPKFLSSMVKECLDEGCEDTDSDIANELRNRLMSAEFKNGVQRIARDCLAKESMTQENIKQTIQKICSQMQRIRIIGKSEIKTFLKYEGERIPNSETSLPFYHECTAENGNTVLQIYVQRNHPNASMLHSLHLYVAKVINESAENRLHSRLYILPLIIGYHPLQKIDEVLTDHEIMKLNAAIKHLLPPIGSYVPEQKVVFLVQNVFMFEVGWLVALEVDDPLDRGERGAAKYKLVEILERLRADSGESTMADRYRVRVSTDGEEQIVDASLLYAFSRDGVSPDRMEQDDEDEEAARDTMIVLKPPGSTDEPPSEPEVPSDYKSIISKLKKQLKEAWTLPEEQRRRIVKRLKFEWHPDKHPPKRKNLVTKVFQMLQNLVALLEQGRSIDDVDEDEAATHASRARNAYGDFMGERARSYRRQQNYRRGANDSYDFRRSRRGQFRPTNSSYHDEYADFFTNFHPPPNQQPADAERWMRQANYDLEAANNEEAPEWACYKCYQVIHFKTYVNKLINVFNIYPINLSAADRRRRRQV